MCDLSINLVPATEGLKGGFWRGSISLTDEINSAEFEETSPVPAKILEYLFLGSEEHSSDRTILQQMGITSVLNVASNCKNHFEDTLTYKNLPVLDNCESDISKIFDEAILFIKEVKKNNGKVLVHCQAGISRSATVCTAYLMERDGIDVDQALQVVREKRKIVAPNFSFMVQLSKYYKELHKM